MNSVVTSSRPGPAVVHRQSVEEAGRETLCLARGLVTASGIHE